ncbi:hypothetical protein [Leuconostoc mesenteroides]|uniref:hypothetical protein n=1 Tax=Leuconostoc mesenteroides TaxID=1245 RepID=UPI00235F2AE5|nr:hypothetical protein [Leuconostoc mesenteroides]
MSVKPRPQSPKKVKSVVRDIKVFDLSLEEMVQRDVRAIQSMFGQLPEIQFFGKNDQILNQGKQQNIEGFSLRLVIENWYDVYDIEFYEKVFKDSTNLSIREYRYRLKSEIVENEFFRFDHNSRMAIIFPAQHINADENKYKKAHYTFPQDIDIDLERVNAENMVNTFTHYLSSGIHPVEERGKEYISIIN